jgi:hypothetical protein
VYATHRGSQKAPCDFTGHFGLSRELRAALEDLPTATHQ